MARARAQRFELAYATKESANEHYREGQPEEARMRYWKAGMLMDVIGNKGTTIEMPAERLDEQNALGVTCWINEAQCYIKMAQNEEETGKNYKGFPTGTKRNPTLWRKAIDSADVALKLDPMNPKAHYKKGLAYQALHEFQKAKEMFEFAKAAHPASREIRDAIVKTKRLESEALEEDKRTYVKIITKSKGLYSDEHHEGPSSGLGAARAAPNPRVWLAFTIDGHPAAERVEIELWANKVGAAPAVLSPRHRHAPPPRATAAPPPRHRRATADVQPGPSNALSRRPPPVALRVAARCARGGWLLFRGLGRPGRGPFRARRFLHQYHRGGSPQVTSTHDRRMATSHAAAARQRGWARSLSSLASAFSQV